MPSENSGPPTPLFWAACGAAVGVFVADSVSTSPALLAALLVAACVHFWLRPERSFWLSFLILVAGGLHHTRHNLSPSRRLLEGLHRPAPHPVLLVGTVQDVPFSDARQVGLPKSTFRLRILSCEPHLPRATGAEVLVHARSHPPACGQTLQLRARLQPVSQVRNPGERDRQGYLARRGIWVEAWVDHPGNLRLLGPAPWWNPLQWAADLRAWISRGLARGLEQHPREHALVVSMVLGTRQPELDEAQEWFRETGTLHLFAVSGFNFSLLAGFLVFLLRPFAMAPWACAFCILPVLLGYAFACGFSPSCLRALLTAGLVFAGSWVETPALPFNALGAAALILLLADGNHLFDTGFQLSFAMVLALLIGVEPLAAFLRRPGQPDPLLPRKLWTASQVRWARLWRACAFALAGSLVAWTGSLPWAFCVFHQVSPAALFCNLPAAPVASLVLALGMLSLLATPVPWLQTALNKLNSLVANSLLTFVHWTSEVPGACVQLPRTLSNPPDLLVFDLADGAAVLLNTSSGPWLLDCGNAVQARAVLQPALRHFGIRDLAGLVLSHGDAAHIGGASLVQEMARPRRVLDGPLRDKSPSRRTFLSHRAARGVPVESVSSGEILQLAPEASLEVLYPPPKLAAALADDKTLVLRWCGPGWTVLYTADAGHPTETWLLRNNPARLRADIWIRGQHGREATGNDDFVEAVAPRVIVVNCSVAGAQRARLSDWASRMRSQDRKVWLQHETGAVQGWLTREKGRRRLGCTLTRDLVEW